MAVLVANAGVALYIEGLAEGEVVPVVDAFADLILSLNFSIDASVLLALVRRFPDGAGHSKRA